MTHSAYTPCRCCPRQCGTDRLNGQRGICGETADLRVASHGPHFGEEPCFTGTRGSGTIFLSGCTCHCLFCQNWQISNAHGSGNPLTSDGLYDIAKNLLQKGVHNINFVTPDHFWPHLEILCERLRADGNKIPILFNTSGYHLPAMISQWASSADIFLPDYKFADPQLAHNIMRDERYPQLALESLREMVAAKGFLEPFDPSGARLAQTGVLVRHLVLPGHVENTLRVLDTLREEFGRWLPLSLMSQFKPTPASRAHPPFDRHLTPDEYNTAVAHAQKLGFENILVQPLDTTDDFFPDFEKKNPFWGNT